MSKLQGHDDLVARAERAGRLSASSAAAVEAVSPTVLFEDAVEDEQSVKHYRCGWDGAAWVSEEAECTPSEWEAALLRVGVPPPLTWRGRSLNSAHPELRWYRAARHAACAGRWRQSAWEPHRAGAAT